MSTLSLDINGTSVTIDRKVFLEYTKESYRILDEISELNKDFKELLDSVAETTKLEKSVVSKYFKSRYKQQTKDVTELGELFNSLDEVLET